MIPGVISQRDIVTKSRHKLTISTIVTGQSVSVNRKYLLGKLISAVTHPSVSVNRSLAKPKAVSVAIGSALTGTRKFFYGVRPVISQAQSISLIKRISTLLLRISIGQLLPTPQISIQAAAFLARTSGLDARHQNAYITLINGLVADGVWSKLDVLYIFATQDSTTALLNLVSSSYNSVAHGSPSFTADVGFTGVDASSSIYIDSQFNTGLLLGSVNFSTNSCHVSAWPNNSVTSSTSGGVIIGQSGASSGYTHLLPRYNDGKAYFRANDSTQGTGFTIASSQGHFVANRSGASASQGYVNGSSFATPNAAAGVLPSNAPIFILANDNNGGPGSGSACQLLMASIGGSLSGTDVTKFYNRLSTYMGTIVGVNLRATQATVQVLRTEA